MKYKHWAKDKIRVAAQIWLWERVAFIYIYITKLKDELTPSRKETVFQLLNYVFSKLSDLGYWSQNNTYPTKKSHDFRYNFKYHFLDDKFYYQA